MLPAFNVLCLYVLVSAHVAIYIAAQDAQVMATIDIVLPVLQSKYYHGPRGLTGDCATIENRLVARCASLSVGLRRPRQCRTRASASKSLSELNFDPR